MKDRKTIIHVIHNLGRGGAETMLVTVIKQLKEYRNIVVTLNPVNHFGDELECDEFHCLDMKWLLSFPLAAIKLRRLIKKYDADLVHTHLMWPTIIARMGVPKNIPLITTIHTFIKPSTDYKLWRIRFLDKMSFKIRKSTIIAVAKGALDEYLEFHGAKKDNTYTLYTFVDVNRFRAAAAVSIKKGDAPLKIAAVGALRIQKNYPFLLEAFRQLKNEDFELHIFGLGPLKEELQEAISQTGVRVILKGEVKNIEQVLPEYDLFVMASTFEGFSLGVLEAMAMRMPLLLSNIPSFREQCEDTAVYFELDKPGDFAEGLKQLAADRQKMEWMGQKAYERVIENFTLEHHMKGLRKIYDNSLV